MFLKHIRWQLIAGVFFFGVATVCGAQEALPVTPTRPPGQIHQDEQESVKVFTEEIVLPVVAYNSYDHFDPTVEPIDILVVEDDVPQQVRSVRRTPVNILLVIDIGSQVTSTKSTATTRDIAAKLVASLRAGDQTAVIQNSKQVELLQDWTTDAEQLQHTVKTKFFSTNRSQLTQCLIAATESLKGKSAGNTHLVLITDGLEAASDGVNYADAVEKLTRLQAATHIISYSGLAQDITKRKARLFGEGIINMDFEMRRWYKNYGEATQQNEQRLIKLAEETGGRILLPGSTEEMVKQADEAIRDIGAQYVVTYASKRPFAAAANGAPQQRRRIVVFPRRAGLRLLALRSYIAAPSR